MGHVEGILLAGTIAGYAIAVALTLVNVVLRRDGLRRAAGRVAAAGWVAHGACIVVRWIATGHAPVQGAYENSLAGAWFLPPLAWYAARRFPAAARALPVVLAAALVLLGNGLMAPADRAPLEPPYRSSWLVVHVTFAWIAFGAYLVSAAFSGYELFVTRGGRAGDRAAALGDVTARLVAVGFLAHTVMIASGAIWAHGLWGRYWGWDPIETWSLVSWLVYGVNLHLRFTLGWSGRRAAWVGVLSVATIVITFFGIGVVSDVHTMLL
jgi:ABC-type transport system involved in cytochrome c biogenesis permease subunit